jgi:hypothetical protein
MVLLLGLTPFLKASLKNHPWLIACSPGSPLPLRWSMLVPRVVTVGSEWSSSLCLSVHIFFSQWPVLQLLTLLLSLHLLDSLVDTLPPLSLVSSLVDALLLRVVAGPPVDALPQWASSLLPRRMLGHRWNPWKMLCRRCLFGPFFGRCFDARSVLALSWWIYT